MSLLWCMVWAFAAEPSSDGVDAEARRLGEEMVAHASAGRRKPLLRDYRRVLDLGVPFDAQLHLLAGEASLAEGDVAGAVARWQRVPEEHAAASEVAERLAALGARYGVVRLAAGPDEVLEGGARFLPEEVAAVEHARARLKEEGVFVGLLPIGSFTLGERTLEVAPLRASQGD
jgi:hypothetical protein